MNALAYPLLAVIGIVLSAHLWERHQRHAPTSTRLELVFFGGLFGMALGAVFGFALAEGIWTLPSDPTRASLDTLLHVFGGKTVTGGLLGAYAGVEVAKRALGHREATGDLFALTVPLSLMLGRVGCVIQGCCLGGPIDKAWYALADIHGTHRWPAAPVELLFNATLLGAFYLRSRRIDATRDRFRGQLFHVYLIAYGVFRFVHEPMRNTPRIWGELTGYQLLAIAIAVLGVARFIQRDRARAFSTTQP